MDGTFLFILAVLLICILFTVISAAYNLGSIDRKLSDIQGILNEIKGNQEGSTTEKKPDSQA